MPDWLIAVILGLVEGLTEFIPVSSTGHLLLTNAALGLTEARWDTFIVLIQLGAILAVVVLYFQRFWRIFLDLLPGTRRGQLGGGPAANRAAWGFLVSVLVAFLPSAVVGVLLHDYIKAVLFNPTIVCVSLITGGVILLLLERFARRVRETDAMRLSLPTALGVGLFQCLAIVPGVSRSGATIFGGLALGVDKRAAAEFSFFLAIPTMLGAFVLDAWESRDQLTPDFLPIVAVGFLVSFVAGLIVVRGMLGFVQRHGFAPFAWWRIAVGIAGLALLHFAG